MAIELRGALVYVLMNTVSTDLTIMYCNCTRGSLFGTRISSQYTVMIHVTPLTTAQHLFLQLIDYSQNFHFLISFNKSK